MTKVIKSNAQGDRLIVAWDSNTSVVKKHLVSTKNLFIFNVFISCIGDTEQYICLYSVTVLVNVHCEILIIYIHYLNITVRNKIKLDIFFHY